MISSYWLQEFEKSEYNPKNCFVMKLSNGKCKRRLFIMDYEGELYVHYNASLLFKCSDKNAREKAQLEKLYSLRDKGIRIFIVKGRVDKYR